MSNGRFLETIKGRKLNSRLTTMMIFEAFFRYFPSKAINSPSLGPDEEEREVDFFSLPLYNFMADLRNDLFKREKDTKSKHTVAIMMFFVALQSFPLFLSLPPTPLERFGLFLVPRKRAAVFFGASSSLSSAAAVRSDPKESSLLPPSRAQG